VSAVERELANRKVKGIYDGLRRLKIPEIDCLKLQLWEVDVLIIYAVNYLSRKNINAVLVVLLM
jgi:hypothetical protein